MTIGILLIRRIFPGGIIPTENVVGIFPGGIIPTDWGRAQARPKVGIFPGGIIPNVHLEVFDDFGILDFLEFLFVVPNLLESLCFRSEFFETYVFLLFCLDMRWTVFLVNTYNYSHRGKVGATPSPPWTLGP